MFTDNGQRRGLCLQIAFFRAITWCRVPSTAHLICSGRRTGRGRADCAPRVTDLQRDVPWRLGLQVVGGGDLGLAPGSAIIAPISLLRCMSKADSNLPGYLLILPQNVTRWISFQV